MTAGDGKGEKSVNKPKKLRASKRILFRQHLNRSTWGNIGVFLFLGIFGVFFAFPIVYSVCTAFKPMNEILIFPPRIFVRNPSLENFIELGQVATDFWVPLSRYIFNSAVISVVATLGHLLLAGMAAYPLAKHPFPGSKFLNQVMVMSLLFTSSVTYIPQYIVMAKLGLIDTPWALILPALQSSLGVYLMRSFILTIPNAMLEAARIDGASEFRIYFQVIFPNVKPAAMTLIIFAFQGIWNNGGGSLIYSEELKVLPAILSSVTAGGIARAGVASAASLILMLPPIILFCFAQRNVIETMSTSGLK